LAHYEVGRGARSFPVGNTWSGEEPQVCTLLERLVSKSLREREIIEDTEGKTTLLSRIGTGLPIAYGSNPHFTADRF
jgi:hypothetical protein